MYSCHILDSLLAFPPYPVLTLELRGLQRMCAYVYVCVSHVCVVCRMLSHDERVTVALRPPALTRTHSPSACRRHPIVSCASVSAGVCMSSSLSGAPRRTRCRHCAIVLRAGRVARHLATLRASVSSRTCALAGAKEGAMRTLRTAKEAWAFDRRGCEKLQNQTSFQLVSNF